MKYFLRISIFLFCIKALSQVDYSSNWGDFYSYNQVLDFVKASEVIYALTDNAAFSYNLTTNEYDKISSVHGLSGSATSVIYQSSETNTLFIGYENGLIEIIDENRSVKRVVDIYLSEIATNKKINAFIEHDNKLYLSMAFGVVVYNLLDFEFEDTYFIGANSSIIEVNNLLISEGYIYASSNDGIYIADFNSNLNDSNNWVKTFSGTFLALAKFDTDLLASRANNVYSIVGNSSLELKLSVPSTIVDMNTNAFGINVATSSQGFVYDENYELDVSTASSSSITVSSIFSDNEFIYLGTKEKGVLQSALVSPNEFLEVYPEGPISNDLFSFTSYNNDIWVVYGAYFGYTPEGFIKPVDHYNGKEWVNIPVSELGFEDKGPVEDLVHVTVDPLNTDRVYVSSWAAGYGSDPLAIDKGGIMVLQNDLFYDFWNDENSGLTRFNEPNTDYWTTRIGVSAFDSEGNLWAVNALVSDGSGALKKRTADGEWSGHVLTKNLAAMDELAIDNLGNVWIGSRDHGMLVYNENGMNEGGDEKRAELNKASGGLPDNTVKAIAVGIDGNIWIGTKSGLVVFSDVNNVFNGSFQKAAPVLIEEDGVTSILLDGAEINDILVDGAGNIWFATVTGGVVQTNSTGKKVLNEFHKDNSALSSNKVLRLDADASTGTVYFGTEDGLVYYKTEVASYGETLTDVYAYPNPALKQHNQISIVGKTSDFPLGTNVKILDVAGNLVFESNATESQSGLGGKFVWDKTNLAGSKVASGVYIILVYDKENNQTASAKIAIVN